MSERALRVGALLFLVPALFQARADTGEAQAVARVRVAEENFRRDPNGTPLATLLEGTELSVAGEDGRWLQVDLEGWIWSPSVAETERSGFDLRVQADGGENLRAQPQGPILARLLEGCLLERLETQGDWTRVRRRGWVWGPSVTSTAPAGAAASTAAPPEAATDTRTEQAPDEPPTLPPVITSTAPLVVFATPDGDTVARFQPGTQAEVLGRAGDWVRIRVDGWVYGPAALDSALEVADGGNVTPAQLRADPGRYRGTLVRWRVQFISFRRAERARSDFEEGEPFIQARGPAGDAGFVYLAVPEALVPKAEALEPLQFVTVVGRVRTGRSQLLASPVIDLTDIETAQP